MDLKLINKIFEVDGGVRDIYILNTTLEDWFNVIDFLNNNYPLSFHPEDGFKKTSKIDKTYIANYFKHYSVEMGAPIAYILLSKINLTCRFYEQENIEFDFSPEQVKSLEEFNIIRNFMIHLNTMLERDIILSYEGCENDPYIKITSTGNIYYKT